MIYFLTDLDDTLLQSAHKVSDEQGKTPVATNSSDVYIGFMSDAQKELFDVLSKNAVVIPITGRDYKTLKRVELDSLFLSYQICSHGAVIMKDGVLEPLWKEHIEKEIVEMSKILEKSLFDIQSLFSELGVLSDKELRGRIICDQGIPAYISVKSDSKIEEFDYEKAFDLIEKMFANQESLRIHRNGRNLAILAPYASKKRAAAFICEQILKINKSDCVIGAGDSISDLPFMQNSTFMLIPTQSQINNKLGQLL